LRGDTLETQEEQDRWLLGRETIRAKILRGLDQLDRGEGIPEAGLGAYLDELKAKPRCKCAAQARSDLVGGGVADGVAGAGEEAAGGGGPGQGLEFGEVGIGDRHD
jgi:hypothetical protein